MKHPLIILSLLCSTVLACGQDKEIILPTPPSPVVNPGDDPGSDPGTPPSQPGEEAENDAMRRTLQMGIGWNVGNELDAFEEDPYDKDFLMPSETVWGNPKIQAVALKKVREAGFMTIRIPVTWLAKIGPEPDYKIDADWMARVTEVAEYARDAGFTTIIIDIHHDENHHEIEDKNGNDADTRWQDLKNAAKDPALNEKIKAEFTAVWTQIAENFRDWDPELLMFEGFNEINDGGWGHSSEFKANPKKQCDILNEWGQTFVDAVRATGGKNATRWLSVPTYCANPAFIQYYRMPSDPAGKVMISVHYYDPSDYTLGTEDKNGNDYLPYSDWGHTGQSGYKHPKYDEDYVRQIFGMLHDDYIAKNIPVYIGEIGCSRRDKKDSRAWAFSLYYLEYISKAARTYGLPAILWDCGGKGVPGPEHHYYFRHDTGEYYPDAKEAVDVVLKGWLNEDPDYTLQSVYDSAPRF